MIYCRTLFVRNKNAQKARDTKARSAQPLTTEYSLPPDWGQLLLADGREIFIDHITTCTSQCSNPPH